MIVAVIAIVNSMSMAACFAIVGAIFLFEDDRDIAELEELKEKENPKKSSASEAFEKAMKQNS